MCITKLFLDAIKRTIKRSIRWSVSTAQITPLFKIIACIIEHL